ncbi:MAG: DUF1499 domain-containing protein [Pseudomonadota bacterium]
MIGRILLFALAGGAAIAIGGAIYTRKVQMDPAVWHADPEAGERTGRPNDFLVADGGDLAPPVLEASPAEVSARLDEIALAEPGTERIAGSPETGWFTYVQRSALMGYPDAVSVKVLPQGDGSRVLIWSRSRFGHSDLGVNRARVERWLAALQG